VAQPTKTTPKSSCTTVSATAFTRSLTIGATGSDVKALQQFLNTKGYKVSATGPGSPGSESTYFGPATTAALARYQAANAISPAVGYFGPLTMATVNKQKGNTTTQVCTTAVPIQTTTTTGSFSRDLTIGSTGTDVLALQKYLNTHGYQVSLSGVGSPGLESTYFGPATAAALSKFQSAKGISPAVGYFGAKTRAAVISMK
jgi:peptidoglycan hydrolase-like protein with peptidoglycan-binding domain